MSDLESRVKALEEKLDALGAHPHPFFHPHWYYPYPYSPYYPPYPYYVPPVTPHPIVTAQTNTGVK